NQCQKKVKDYSRFHTFSFHSLRLLDSPGSSRLRLSRDLRQIRSNPSVVSRQWSLPPSIQCQMIRELTPANRVASSSVTISAAHPQNGKYADPEERWTLMAMTRLVSTVTSVRLLLHIWSPIEQVALVSSLRRPPVVVARAKGFD